MTRRDELATGLAQTRERIARACDAAGRDPAEVTLIVVTKTYPATDVALLVELGVTDVGENRHPEAGRKLAELAGLGVTEPPRMHFIGGLQTNKAGAVSRYADVVHSVDRLRLVDGLSRGAVAAGRTLGCLVQVDFDTTDPGRAGAVPADVDEVATHMANAEGLRLAGVMTVAPLGVDPGPVFTRLAEISERLRTSHPDAIAISAGMSGDLEDAVKAGATHVRVGRSVLGERGSAR